MNSTQTNTHKQAANADLTAAELDASRRLAAYRTGTAAAADALRLAADVEEAAWVAVTVAVLPADQAAAAAAHRAAFAAHAAAVLAVWVAND